MENVLGVAVAPRTVAERTQITVRPSFRRIFGLPLCDLQWEEALIHLRSLINRDGRQTVLSFVNAHNANVMLRDPTYRAALSRQLVFPDGIGVNIASRVLTGSQFPANLNGTDLIPALLTYVGQPLRIGMLGARREVLEQAMSNYRRNTPWHRFFAVSDGYFDKDNCEPVLDRIRSLDLDVLIIGMGTPLQEVWVDRHIKPEHASLVITGGAVFDFASGAVSRAPITWRQSGLEWLHRLRLEPRRLWKRYVLGIPLFFVNLLLWKWVLRNEQL